MEMNGRVAIVTGAGQGIGKGIALKFLQAGMKVVLADADEDAGREAESEMRPRGEVLFVRCDVSREEDVVAMVEQAQERFERIDALVNNAGIMRARTDPTKLSLAEWNAVIGVNLTGAFLCAKHAAPHLAMRKGAIVNIASTRALMSEPDTEAYAASKGGLVALTHALAVSLGPDVRVNAISPGWIEVGDWKKRSERVVPRHSEQDEKQHPAGRVGVPEDVAELALFLVSPASGFMTGANLVLDGGMTRKMIYAE